MEIRVRRTKPNDQSQDELYHWKYITKVKLSNGKYRYVYDDGVKSQSPGLGEKAAYELAKKKHNENVKSASAAVNTYKNSLLKSITSKSPGSRIKRQAAYETFSDSLKTANKSKSRVDRALSKYSNTRLGEFEGKVRENVSKSISTVNKALNKYRK